MAIETTCQTCGKRLRVADEHAGKLAKCPACQSIYTVPLTPALSLETPAAVVVSPAASALSLSNPGHPDRWHLRTPDGLTFGPVTKEVLDQWQREQNSLDRHQGDVWDVENPAILSRNVPREQYRNHRHGWQIPSVRPKPMESLGHQG